MTAIRAQTPPSNSDEATWDEQGCTPARPAPQPTLHAHTGALRGTPGDTAADGRVTTFRQQPTPCTCRTCAAPCQWSVRADLPWTVCHQCRRGGHRRVTA